jgi:CRP-like cAMP-binding protein
VQRANAAVLGQIALFQRVSADDRERVIDLSWTRDFDRGDVIFDEGDPSDTFFVVVTGKVKVFKRGPDGHDVILEIFGPGSPLGAVAAFESRPYPASAVPLEPSTCLLMPRDAFFALLERHPSLVRGLLGSLSLRLVELTSRLSEIAGGRVDARLARLFLKLADRLGKPQLDGIFIPLPLTRQEVADMVGTTIETAIRVMSRWSKDGILLTEKDGFTLVDRGELESIAES